MVQRKVPRAGERPRRTSEKEGCVFRRRQKEVTRNSYEQRRQKELRAQQTASSKNMLRAQETDRKDTNMAQH